MCGPREREHTRDLVERAADALVERRREHAECAWGRREEKEGVPAGDEEREEGVCGKRVSGRCEEGRERMRLLSNDGLVRGERGEAEPTMWCTPTSGLFRAAARVFAAFEPTLRHPPIPGILVSTSR